MSNKNTKVLQLVALRKVVDSIAKKIYGSDYKNYLSDPQIMRDVLISIGGDDWGTLMKTAAVHVLPHLWKWAKGTTRGK